MLRARADEVIVTWQCRLLVLNGHGDPIVRCRPSGEADSSVPSRNAVNLKPSHQALLEEKSPPSSLGKMAAVARELELDMSGSSVFKRIRWPLLCKLLSSLSTAMVSERARVRRWEFIADAVGRRKLITGATNELI
jgi:hypothetical protein